MAEVNKRNIILAEIEDLVSKLLYYDRKEDPDLRVGEIDIAVEQGDITVGEMIGCFADELIMAFND